MPNGPGNALRWLADLVSQTGPPPGNLRPANAIVAARRIGAKLTLALQFENVEAVGIDMVHAAVNELAVMHAMPIATSLAVTGHAAGGVAETVVAGIARACRAHDLPIEVRLAEEAADEAVVVEVAGEVIGPPPIELQAGDSVLALRGTGPTEGDQRFLLGVAAERAIDLGSTLKGESLARTLTAPRASHLSLLHEPLRTAWPFVGAAIDEGGLIGSVQAILPPGLGVRWNLDTLRMPSPFADWFVEPERRLAAARSCSLGHDLVVVVHGEDRARWLALCAAWGEPASVLGSVELA